MPHTAFHQIDPEDRVILDHIYNTLLGCGASERAARERYAAELALIDRLRAPSQPDTATA